MSDFALLFAFGAGLVAGLAVGFTVAAHRNASATAEERGVVDLAERAQVREAMKMLHVRERLRRAVADNDERGIRRCALELAGMPVPAQTESRDAPGGES